MDKLSALAGKVVDDGVGRAGVYLIAKYGTQRSALTLARAIPVAGGLIGGSVDAALTGVIGKAAKKAFTSEAH